MRAVAEEKSKRADKDARDAAAAYRNLASITAVSEPGRAREYYAEAARLDPSNVEGMYRNAWFQKEAGRLAAAQEGYARVIAMAKPGSDDGAVCWGEAGHGEIQQQRGNFNEALATYRDAATMAARLARADPGNAIWQINLAASYDKIGDVLMAQGDLGGALTSYRNSHVTTDRLAKANPGITGWQYDLSVT